MYANGASPNGLEAHGVAAQRPMEAHGTYLDNFRDLTPPRTIDVVRRMFSWAMVLAVCSGGGWGVYRYGPEFKEKWPEMKVSATNWWFELTTGQTPTDVLSGTNTQGQVLTR
jgi:hypothetical protein